MKKANGITQRAWHGMWGKFIDSRCSSGKLLIGMHLMFLAFGKWNKKINLTIFLGCMRFRCKAKRFSDKKLVNPANLKFAARWMTFWPYFSFKEAINCCMSFMNIPCDSSNTTQNQIQIYQPKILFIISQPSTSNH